ncbi:DUF6611 family protein [Leifsonia sp. NPDC058194]|uniref:DUF6611 family protein n=1 Tax=Leifsonia sp. NPDC058194 TaxID=3346374 RepID=UPI0036D814D4
MDGVSAHRRWGRLDVTPLQIARARRSLDAVITIYPPGTTKAESRALAVHGAGTQWIGWITATLLFLTASAAFGLWPGGICVALMLLAVWTVAAVTTDSVRRRSRVVRARFTPQSSLGDERFSAIASALDDLDQRRDRDPVSYELEWGRIFNQLTP